MPDYELGLTAALNEVMRMFDKEHSWYQELWKRDADAEDMYRQEIRLRMLNEVICQLEQMRRVRKGR